MRKIGLQEIKKAILNDSRFRSALPDYLKEEVNKFISNPGCPSCSVNLMREILKNCRKQLQEYFPNKEIVNEEEEIKKLATNNWSVINCSIDDLEDKLKRLPPGRKQVAIARYEEKITLVVNELDFVF